MSSSYSVAVHGAAGAVGTDLVAQLDVDPEVGSIVGLDATGPAPGSNGGGRPQKLKMEAALPADLGKHFKDAGIKLAVYLSPSAAASTEGAVPADDTVALAGFLNACETAGVEGIVVASGGTVYGARRENPSFFIEGAPLRPGGLAAGELDLARERLCASFARRRPEVALAVCRLAPAVVGPGVRGIVGQFLVGAKFVVLQEFDPAVQFLHLEDVSRAIFRLLKARRTGVYNIAPDDYTSFLQLGRAFKKPLQRVSLRWARVRAWLGTLVGGAPKEMLPLLQFPILLSNKKLKRDTGFVFKYGSEQALAHHAKHLLRAPEPAAS